MSEGRTVTLNDKGILLLGIVILFLVFALGFMTSIKMKEQKATVFTREELEKIVKLQAIEDEEKSGAEIYAYKDDNGNLMIGWSFDN